MSTTISISIYTDGSCNPASKTGGWAAIILENGKKTILSGHEYNTTHQRMELMSVIKALKFIEGNNLIVSPIILYTDSQYVTRLNLRKTKLKATGFITRSKSVLRNTDLINEIYSYYEQLSISVVKVKAHQNGSVEEKLNSEADKLCRKVVRSFNNR